MNHVYKSETCDKGELLPEEELAKYWTVISCYSCFHV